MYEREKALVEEVLESYPPCFRENYYNNKKALTINKKEKEINFCGISGTYDEVNNKITLYEDNAIIHELFHVSFRNGKKLNQTISDEYPYYYSNGITFKTDKNKIGEGLTEGFVEYLSRKVCNTKGHCFEYFIVDLLISIYGEDILKYPFTNDIVGFYQDKRFFDIMSLMSNLDFYFIYKKDITLFIECSKIIMEEETNVALAKTKIKRNLKHIDKSILELYKNIINCINIIIKEYEHCDYPKIEQYQFTSKVEEFIKDPSYKSIINLFEYNNYDINKKIEKSLRKIRRK